MIPIVKYEKSANSSIVLSQFYKYYIVHRDLFSRLLHKHGAAKNIPTINHVSTVNVLSCFLCWDCRGSILAVDRKGLANFLNMQFLNVLKFSFFFLNFCHEKCLSKITNPARQREKEVCLVDLNIFIEHV